MMFISILYCSYVHPIYVYKSSESLITVRGHFHKNRTVFIVVAAVGKPQWKQWMPIQRTIEQLVVD